MIFFFIYNMSKQVTIIFTYIKHDIYGGKVEHDINIKLPCHMMTTNLRHVLGCMRDNILVNRSTNNTYYDSGQLDKQAFKSEMERMIGLLNQNNILDDNDIDIVEIFDMASKGDKIINRPQLNQNNRPQSNQKSKNVKKVKCWKCKQFGHFKRDCLN